MGLQAPSNAERRRALDEALAAVRRLWDGEPFTFIPAENRFTGHALVHGPVQQPRVPLLIGGAGEKVTLRRVAEQADACNFVNATPDEVRRKYDVLRAHCEAVGRPYDTILRSHLLNVVTLAPTESAALTRLNLLEGWKRDRAAKFAMTPEQLIRFYDPLIRAGVQYVIPSLTRYDDLETLELLAERVVPELQAIANV
jgi:alkanesulfonate monooxygenase SsuD/methylene tetrahydromethanopterin reductase-like flavin-dependent oxidoreductase (luciferase family)